MIDFFQDCGFSLGFVSYPYNIDGHDLFKDVFEKQFFNKYKEGIDKYSIQSLSDYLYKPKGYRLFGNYGLAVLSLIDDFAFCDRIFHANHGYAKKNDTATESDTAKKDDTSKYRYYTRVVTGITSHKEKDYLLNKSGDTFLRTENRYPFIGTIKLKINNNILFGRGISITEKIKELILILSDEKKNDNEFDSIVVDCFDNDELAVISFSNDISLINSFFSQIRDFTFDKLGLPSDAKKEHQHVFLSCITNIGYDIEYKFVSPELEESENANPLFVTAKDLDKVKIKVIWETRVGHHNLFKKYLEKHFPCNSITEYTLTGGNAMSFHMHLNKIHFLEEQCGEKELEHHVKKIKIVLNWRESNQYHLDEQTELEMRNGSSSLAHLAFSLDKLGDIRALLNECRVSKIVRERLLKIYGLFNESIRDVLHSGYFYELKEALNNIEDILKHFSKDRSVSVGEIDVCLSELITSIEEAYYNRFHQREMRDTNLEYNGGIQQHITSYDFAYKKILEILSPQNIREKEAKKSFISISGYEKVASIRMNLRLNINQISYPELFSISVWKEACNFSYPLSRKELENNMDDPRNEEQEVYFRKYSVWSKFKEQKKTFINLRSVLTNNPFFDNNDSTYYTVSRLMNKETIEYFFIDAFSYHFGFHQNYELFYHCYWKYFLQISQHYNREGKIDKNYFISYLLRLFMIGFRSTINWQTKKVDTTVPFMLDQRFKPFDPVLADLWLLCYEKVYKCADILWNELNKFYFEEVTNKEINTIELTLTDSSKLSEIEKLAKEKYDKIRFSNSFIALQRKKIIEKISEKIKSGHLGILENVDLDGFDDYIICLLNAYLLAIKELDEKGVEKIVLRCLPRDAKGEILLIENDKEDKLRKCISNLPVDPLGGIFITNHGTRGEYFKYRTSLYRSLWNYAMLNRKL